MPPPLAARAAAVRAAFAAEYVDDHGDLPVRLQGVYVLALAFEMVPVDAVRARTAARLVELMHERGDRLDTGFLSTPYLLDVLWDHGYPDVARTLLWQSEMPSWLYEVDHGATTIWESWDAISPDGEIRPMSFNHYAPGSVDDWLYRRVAGIRSTSPGLSHRRDRAGLRDGARPVRAHVGTPYGRLAWSGRGRGMRHPSWSRCRSAWRRPRDPRDGCGAGAGTERARGRPRRRAMRRRGSGQARGMDEGHS